MIPMTTSYVPMHAPARRKPLPGFPVVWGMAVLATAAVLAAASAHAGRACDERKPVTAQVIERGMALAAQTSQALDAENERSGAIMLHAQPYSMVSYAWGTKYQQSSQWALETLAFAMEPTTVRTREQAQAWLRFKGYESTALKLGPLTRLGGRVGRYAILAPNRYLERQRLAESLPDAQRREELGYDVVMARLAKSVCPGCDRAVELKNEAIDYYPHCGLCLFDRCGHCSTRKNAFSRYCFSCGTLSATESVTDGAAEGVADVPQAAEPGSSAAPVRP